VVVDTAVSLALGGDGDPSLWDVLPLHLLDLHDVDYMQMLFELLRRQPGVVRFYLDNLVFPETTAHQRSKLSANGQDLGGEMLFARRIAFSGTPSSLLPLEMGQCIHSMGDDAKMLRTLTEPAVVSPASLPSAWDVPGVLDAVAALRPPAHALIDCGALVTGMNNREVAEYLLHRLPPTHEGVVFLESGGHKKILLRATGGVMDLERCGTPPERRFSFYDQVCTRPA